jgi:hypothetical protein
MAEKKTPVSGHSTITRSDILIAIKEQLHVGLSSLKEQLGEKKFEKRIKKAAKLLVAGVEKKTAKKPVDIAKKTVAPEKKTSEAKTTAPAKKSIEAKKTAPAKKSIATKKTATPKKSIVAQNLTKKK